jgi:hypothetical protein
VIGLAKVVIVTVSLASLFSGGALVALTGAPGPGGGSDYGLDSDGDGRFDWLIVKMDLSVETANWYNVWATLGTDKPFGRGCGFGGVPMPLGSTPYPGGLIRDGTTTIEPQEYPISWASVRQFFEAGNHQVSLAFKGTDLGFAGVDGPYTVRAQMHADGEWDSRIMDPVYGAPILPPSGWDWTYVTRAYEAAAFEDPRFAIRFTGTSSDSGLDLDGDGLYDYLVISAEADVALAGTYAVGGTLMSGSDPMTWMWIVGTWGSVELAEGRQTIEYRFSGQDIWASGLSGSFRFTVDAYYGGGIWWGNGTGIREGEPYPGQPSQPEGFDLYGDSACGATPEYRHEQFEERVEPAKYTGVFRDYGEDYDGDGLFDALVVEAEVEVLEANVFDFSGQLMSEDRTVWISGAYQQMYLEVGTHTLALRFPGPDIRRSGVDGPYRADLNLVVAFRDPATSILTAAYRHTDFAGDGGSTRGMHWIGNMTADLTTVTVLVVRGLDMLDVVIEDVLIVEAFAASGEIVFTAQDKVYLPSGGDTQTFAFTWSPSPGTYVLRASLAGTNEVVEIRVTV